MIRKIGIFIVIALLQTVLTPQNITAQNNKNDPRFVKVYATDFVPDDIPLFINVVNSEIGTTPNSFTDKVLIAQTLRNVLETEQCTVASLADNFHFANKDYELNFESVYACLLVMTGWGVTHEKVMCFYSHKIMYSKWHEQQALIMQTEHGRYFKYK